MLLENHISRGLPVSGENPGLHESKKPIESKRLLKKYFNPIVLSLSYIQQTQHCIGTF